MGKTKKELEEYIEELQHDIKCLKGTNEELKALASDKCASIFATALMADFDKVVITKTEDAITVVGENTKEHWEERWEADPSIDQFMRYDLPVNAKLISKTIIGDVLFINYEWKDNGVLHRCRIELPAGK